MTALAPRQSAAVATPVLRQSRGLELGLAGALVYVTGRSTRGHLSPMQRPETIDETAELIEGAGGTAIAVRDDHTQPLQVAALVERIGLEQDRRLDILVNDIWGGDSLRPFGVTAVAVSPGFLRSEAMLDHFGVTAETWRDAITQDRHFVASETPRFLGRGVAALAGDPDLPAQSGKAFGSWDLARKYGITDVDGSRPDWGAYYRDLVLTSQRSVRWPGGKAKTPYRIEACDVVGPRS